MLHLRELKESDTAAILEMGKGIFREADEIPLLKKALRQAITSLSFVASIDDNIVGFILSCKKMTECYFRFMKTIPNCYEIAFLGISPSYQGHGIGSRLLKESIHAIFQISFSGACWLLVDMSNSIALNLYKRNGFKVWRKTNRGKTHVPGYILGLHRHMYNLRSTPHLLGTVSGA